jgi:hypothetical protein
MRRSTKFFTAAAGWVATIGSGVVSIGYATMKGNVADVVLRLGFPDTAQAINSLPWVDPAVGLFCGAILFFLLSAGLVSWVREHRHGKIAGRILCGHERGKFCAPVAEGTAIRLKVELPFDDRMGREARAYLASVQIREDGHWGKSVLAEGMNPRLGWPSGQGPDHFYEPANFKKSSMILFLRFNEKEKRLLLITRDHYTGLRDYQNNFPVGEYRFTVCVEGDNFDTIRQAFRVVWTGDIEAIRIEPSPDEFRGCRWLPCIGRRRRP